MICRGQRGRERVRIVGQNGQDRVRTGSEQRGQGQISQNGVRRVRTIRTG